jgi:ATP-dependent Clp protease ATP-binding subunit ClpC
MESAVSQKDFEKAQFYREQEVTARENLQFVRESFAVKSSARKVIVGKAEIDEVVSKWTGVPDGVDQPGRRRQAPAHGG